MEVLRRCPLAIAQRLVHCAIALSTAVLDRVTKTMSVAPLLMNNLDNSKQKTSNLLSPAPPPYPWSLLGKSEGPAPPPSSKISWSFDLAWSPEAVPWKSIYTTISAEALLSVVSWGSRPTEILSDRGTQFTSDLTKEVFILVSSADHFATSPCHAMPRRMGRLNNSTARWLINTMVRVMASEKWETGLRYLRTSFAVCIQTDDNGTHLIWTVQFQVK